MKKIKTLRKWLIKNKVFFEVFSFILLGTASVLVSVLSYKTSKSQLELQRIEFRPIINIQREYLGEYIQLNIENVGFHLFDPKIDYRTFYVINDFKNNVVNQPTDFYFEFKDYFNLNYETGNSVGVISELSSSDYTKSDSKGLIVDMMRNHRDNYRTSEFVHLLKIDFRDDNELKYKKHFYIDSFSIYEISATEYKEKLEFIGLHSLPKNNYLNKTKINYLLKDIPNIYPKILDHIRKLEAKTRDRE